MQSNFSIHQLVNRHHLIIPTSKSDSSLKVDILNDIFNASVKREGKELKKIYLYEICLSILNLLNRIFFEASHVCDKEKKILTITISKKNASDYKN